ncbi:hypothetical protein S40288_08990 [Stachybotrys chartarum IBT 40288]|nr:hypothetical protein S40288_08990 [Stachybotrys chartarum IBT 40288]
MVSPATRVPAAPKVLPLAVTIGTVSAAVGYVRWQLFTSSSKLDRSFAAYNNAQSEASRRRAFEGATDTRDALFNVLGWGK